jgi:hypothetical protein
MENFVSILFTCKGRPNLTELCLRRLVELMPQPYELALAYDGEDIDYVSRLLEVYDFDHIIMNHGGKNHRFWLMNEALDKCDGDYYMHVENDFYWDRPGVVGSAIEAFEQVPELSFIRFEFLPHRENICQRKVPLTDDTLCLFKPRTPYAFNFNPHLRKEKFPAGKYPLERDWLPGQPEKSFGLKWEKRGETAGCLMGPNFRHVGVYDEGGFYKQMYAERFTLRRGEGEFDPRAEFYRFCGNEAYRRLFDEYLDTQRKHRIVVLAFDGLDYGIVQSKCPELNQKIHGRTSLDNHIVGGGSPRPFTMEVFATLLTGTTPDVHGVKEKFNHKLTLKGKQKTIFDLTDSVAVDVPAYNTHPILRKFHGRCDWAFGYEAFRKKVGLSEEEYWGKVVVHRDALEKDLYDYLYTVKMDRIRAALSQKKNLTMIYFWFSDIIGHLGFKENDERIDRMYVHVKSVFNKIKEMLGDEVLIVMSDHGLMRGRHRPNEAYWSMSHQLMRGNQNPQMEEWSHIINRIVKK